MPVDQIQIQTSIQRHGSQTVMYTYLALMLLDKIPAISSVAGRKKAIQELKDRVGSKNFTGKNSSSSSITKSVIERANELHEGKLFDRVDFESLSKAMKAKTEKSNSKGEGEDKAEKCKSKGESTADACKEGADKKEGGESKAALGDKKEEDAESKADAAGEGVES